LISALAGLGEESVNISMATKKQNVVPTGIRRAALALRNAKLTRTIAGQEVTLTIGRTYVATRPAAERKHQRFTVSITCTDGGFSLQAIEYLAEARIPNLSYDEANAFLAAFNNAECCWDGRVW
jgi:hypothetical protein